MKKRRGKRPVKPNLEEALKDRVVDLKGIQHSSMNIPIIYRRTFGWEGDAVLFRPISKRAFVVQPLDLGNEDLVAEGYVNKELDLRSLPHYLNTRKEADQEDQYHIEELKESLISFSLLDRYVNIDIKKPEDKELDLLLRKDLEYLGVELGYDYSISTESYRCTFIFPKYSNEQTVKRCVRAIKDSLELLKDFQKDVKNYDLATAQSILDDLSYSISNTEHNIDRFYTEALNVIWDLPQMEAAGHFLIIQACERVYDEVEFIIRCSREVAKLLTKDKKGGFLWEMFINLWMTSIKSALASLEEALGTVEGDEAVSECLNMLRRHRQYKDLRSSNQVAYVSHITRALENTEGEGYKPLVSKEQVEVLHHLFGMNQSSTRIEEISSIIATKVLYLRNSSLGND